MAAMRAEQPPGTPAGSYRRGKPRSAFHSCPDTGPAPEGEGTEAYAFRTNFTLSRKPLHLPRSLETPELASHDLYLHFVQKSPNHAGKGAGLPGNFESSRTRDATVFLFCLDCLSDSLLIH